MRKKRSLSLFIPAFILLLALTSSVFARSFSFFLYAGYNKSRMYYLKDINKNFVNTFKSYEVPITVGDNFPSYLFIDPRVSWRFSQNNRLGFHFLYTSTGSQVWYHDYSGELKLEQVARLYAPGLSWEHRSASFRRVELWIVFDCNYLYSKYQILNVFRLFNEGERSFKKYSAHGFAFEPGFHLTYTLGRMLLNFRMDYRFSYSTDLFTRKNGKTEYFMVNNTRVPIQWDGWLWGFGIGFRLDTIPSGAP